jgi:hypothetical protein
MFIPFDGDVELWDLSPGDLGEDEACGAVAFLEYVVSTVETSESAALQRLSEQVAAAERMIELQRAPIRAFNASLHEQVARDIENRRHAETVH